METQVKELKQRLEEHKPLLEIGWWIKILTDQPLCLYYFGPFDSYYEAHLNQDGYIQDLKEEKAQLEFIEILWCQPLEATIFLDNQFE